MPRWLRIVIALVAFALPAHADDLDTILASGVVRAGVCLKAEPLGFRDSDGTPRGYDVDVAGLLAEALDARLELVETTTQTRIQDLLDNRFEIIVCNLTATPARARSIDFSLPYLRSGLKLLVQRDGGITGPGDIGEGIRLVTPRGTTGAALAAARFPAAEVAFAGPGEATLLMRTHEADVYIDDSTVVDFIARAHGDQLVALPETHTFDAISFGVRKGNPQLLRWLDLFASTYVSSGRYAESYERWWGGPPPPLTAIW